MAVPSLIRAGDTVRWIEPATVDTLGNPVASGAWTATAYLRFNAASEALTISSTARNDGGWQFEISATASGGMDPGRWYYQARAQQGAVVITLATAGLTVERSLAYTGGAAAFDGRSQARKDLEAVQSAIRSIVSGGAVAEYTIGTRRLKKMPLPDLIALENKLKADVSREERAEKIANGLGDPRKLHVRFRR